MEAGDRLNCHLYSCALCENLSDLSSPCCCQENTENMTEVTEPRLLKRCNLQEGDSLCAVHYDKLKSGIIFGGGGGKSRCCAPFHVEQNHASRLRPVPRVWRQLFDSSDVNNRYLPSLQICSQCYNITLDLVLNEENKDEEQEGEDSSDTSSNEHNTSPRRWMSSIGLHNTSAGGSSESSWSLNSSQQPVDSSTHLMSLYTAHNQTPFPTVIPDSVKRYFRYSKRIGSVFNRKRKVMSRADSVESPDESFIGNETPQNDCYHKPADRSGNNASSLLQCSQVESNNSEKETMCTSEAQIEPIVKEPTVKLTLTPKSKMKKNLQPKKRNAGKFTFVSNERLSLQEDALLDFSTQIARSENATLIGTSENPISEESVECQRCILNTREKLKGDLNAAAESKISIQTSCVDTSENDVSNVSHERKPMMITIKSVATSPRARQSESIDDVIVSKPPAEGSPQLVSKNCSNIQFISIAPKNNCLEDEVPTRSVNNSCVSTIMNNDCIETKSQCRNKNGISISRSSESRRNSMQDVIEFLLTNFHGSDGSQTTANKLITLIDKLRSNALQVFASTLAQSIVDFALQDDRIYTTSYDKKEEKCCDNNDDEISLQSTWLQDVEVSPQNLVICAQCGAPIFGKISSIKTFAQGRANDIVFDALQQVPEKRQKLIGQAETLDDQETITKEKTYYRSEFSIQINDDKSYDKKLKTTANSSKANKQIDESKNKNHDNHCDDSSFRVISCIVEDLIPVTRSFSTGFIDKCVEDEDGDWSFHPLVRSSSTESFFTMTYQLSDEQKSSDEFVVVPIGTTSQPHKEVESGVFMSATETDPSCTDSLTSPSTDYSDTDRESMSSHFTQMSSIDNLGITELCDTPDLTGLNKNTQGEQKIPNEILSPAIDENSITLENLHSSELPQTIIQEFVVPTIGADVQESSCDDDLHPNAANALDAAPIDNNSLSMESSLHSGESLASEPKVHPDEMSLHSAYSRPKADNDVVDSILAPAHELISDATHSESNNKDVSGQTPLLNTNDTTYSTLQGVLSEDDRGNEINFKDSAANQPLTSIAEDQSDEQTSTATSTARRRNEFREKTDRSTVDWFPSDDVLRQRQSTEFVRAINQAALLNTRAPSITRDKLRKSDEEPEDEDVCEVIGAVMEEATPPFLRRKPRMKEEDNSKQPSTFILRIFTAMAVLGFVLFVSWRYYLSLLV